MRYVRCALLIAVMGCVVGGGCDIFEEVPGHTLESGSATLDTSWRTLTEVKVSEPGTLYGSISFNGSTDVECVFEHAASGKLVGQSHGVVSPSTTAHVSAEDVAQDWKWRFKARIYTFGSSSDSDVTSQSISFEVRFDPDSKPEDDGG
jgi:hypothetical protein